MVYLSIAVICILLSNAIYSFAYAPCIHAWAWDRDCVFIYFTIFNVYDWASGLLISSIASAFIYVQSKRHVLQVNFFSRSVWIAFAVKVWKLILESGIKKESSKMFATIGAASHWFSIATSTRRLYFICSACTAMNAQHFETECINHLITWAEIGRCKSARARVSLTTDIRRDTLYYYGVDSNLCIHAKAFVFAWWIKPSAAR